MKSATIVLYFLMFCTVRMTFEQNISDRVKIFSYTKNTLKYSGIFYKTAFTRIEFILKQNFL